MQCLNTCLHAIDLLEVGYDLDIKSYDDILVWAYEPLDRIHFFVNSLEISNFDVGET